MSRRALGRLAAGLGVVGAGGAACGRPQAGSRSTPAAPPPAPSGLGIGYVLGHEQFTTAQLFDQAQAAEHAGFRYAWASDHLQPWQDDEGHSMFPWHTLALLSQRTNQIIFGSGVTCPIYRYHPAIVAQAFASLALLAPGRVFLGVGTGERLNEQAATTQFGPYQERHDRLVEAIQLIRQLWSACPNAMQAGKSGMIRFLARRFLNYVVLLVLASFLTFCLTSVTFHPLDSFAQRHPQPPAAAIHAKAVQLGLDKPIPVRYAKWISGVVRGDFGATVTGHPVSQELWRRIGVSLRLVVIGSVLGTVIGVIAGAWGAVRQYRLSDRVITVLSLTVLSIPTFVLAGLLILGALRVNMFTGVGIFQDTGETSPIPPTGLWDQLVDRVQHIVLPTLTLALLTIASFSRYQRNAMLDVLSEDFIRTARAKGLTRRRALFKHGLRTALIPLATLFAYGVSGLVVGTVFVEKIFGWHGMGEWVVLGISTQDTNVVAAITMISGATVLLAGLLSDVIYAALDPRVRVS